MVDFKKLGEQAKDLVDKRGGTDGLKQDAEQLKSIARGNGSLADKAKAAAEALKTPGGEAEKAAPLAGDEAAPEPAPAEPGKHAGDPLADEARAERKAERRAERAGRREGR